MSIVRDCLDRILPENAHQLCTGRLFVCKTGLDWWNFDFCAPLKLSRSMKPEQMWSFPSSAARRNLFKRFCAVATFQFFAGILSPNFGEPNLLTEDFLTISPFLMKTQSQFHHFLAVILGFLALCNQCFVIQNLIFVRWTMRVLASLALFIIIRKEWHGNLSLKTFF